MADSADTPDDNAVDRLRDHLDELDDKPEEMQRRLDDLGEGIDEARRQAEADELLPSDDEGAGPTADQMDWPGGDASRETRVTDTDVEPSG